MNLNKLTGIELTERMLPRRQEYGLKRAGGARSGSVINFRTTVSSGSVRRSSAVLPSVLTFLVIVASGGLLLMIEKGMLNSMETPPPRGSGKRLDFMRQAGKNGPAAADMESQVKETSRSTKLCRRVIMLVITRRIAPVYKQRFRFFS